MPYLTVGLFNILQSIVYIVMVVKSDTEDSKPGMYVYLGFSMGKYTKVDWFSITNAPPSFQSSSCTSGSVRFPCSSG